MAQRARSRCAGSLLDAVSASLATCPRGAAEGAAEAPVAEADDVEETMPAAGDEAAPDGPLAGVVEGARRGRKRRGAATAAASSSGGGEGDEDPSVALPTSAEALAEAASAARDAIDTLRAERPLYASVRLPELEKGSSGAGAGGAANKGSKRARLLA